MTVHTILHAGIVGGLSALLWRADGGTAQAATAVSVPARAATWLLAGWRWRRAAHTAWVAGADLMRALAEPVTVEPPPWRDAPPPAGGGLCPSCGGRRCRPHREGRDCRHEGITEPAAYSAARQLPRDGRHSSAVRIAHWARIDALHQLRRMVEIAPGRYAAKLGRPVALPHRVVMSP